jgi:hypothetical protein
VSEEAATVGGVWAIAAVSAEEWVEVKKGGKANIVKEKLGSACVVCNRFEALGDAVQADYETDGEFKGEEASERKVVKKIRFRSIFKHGSVHNEDIDEGMTNKKMAVISTVPFAECCGGYGVSCLRGPPPGLGVCAVESGSRRWKKIGVGEITVDSAAEESVCPREWCKDFGTRAPDKLLKFVNASGGPMGHYGERTANFKLEGKESGIMSLNFQVSDVQKPLVAVRRITEKGNVVQFGPRAEDNFIKNTVTGVKIAMVKKGGSYVIPAEMLVEDFPRQAQ